MRYLCTIADAGFDDVVVPISSFQIRFNQSPSQCYLQATVPGIAYVDQIVERQAGTIRIDSVVEDGTITEVLTANLSSITPHYGASNRSINIVAYKQATWPGTGAFTLANISYYSSQRVRCLPNDGIRPDDEITFEGRTLLVSSVNLQVNTTNRTQEITYREFPDIVSATASPVTGTLTLLSSITQEASTAPIAGTLSLSGTATATSLVVYTSPQRLTALLYATVEIGQTFRDLVLALGPIGFWPFYDASGAVLTDYVTVLDGDVLPSSSNITWRDDGPSPDRSNIGALFDAYPAVPTEDGYVSLVNGDILPVSYQSLGNIGESFTIFGFVKTTKTPTGDSSEGHPITGGYIESAIPSNDCIILQLQQNVDRQPELPVNIYSLTFAVGLRPSGAFAIGVAATGSTQSSGNVFWSPATAPHLNDGKWHFAAAIFDRTSNLVNFYIDGVWYSNINDWIDYIDPVTSIKYPLDYSPGSETCLFAFNTRFDRNHTRVSNSGVAAGDLYGWGLCNFALTQAQLDTLYVAGMHDIVEIAQTPITGDLAVSGTIALSEILQTPSPFALSATLSGTGTVQNLSTAYLDASIALSPLLFLGFNDVSGDAVEDLASTHDGTVYPTDHALRLYDGPSPRNLGAWFLPYPIVATQDGYVNVWNGATPAEFQALNSSGNSFTLFGWLRTSKTPSTTASFYVSDCSIMQLMQNAYGSGNKCAFNFCINASGYLAAGFYNGSTATIVTDNRVINSDGWHFVALCVDRTVHTVSFYADGTLGSSQAITDLDYSVGNVNSALYLNAYRTDAGFVSNSGISPGGLFGWGISGGVLSQAQLDVLLAAVRSDGVLIAHSSLSMQGLVQGTLDVNNPGVSVLVSPAIITAQAVPSGTVEIGTPSILPPISTGLTGYWPFIEGSGATVADYSGNGKDFDIEHSNTSLWVADANMPNGNAVLFNGGDCLLGPTGFSINDTSADKPFTVIARMAATNIFNNHYLFSVYLNSIGFEWHVRLYNGQPNLYVYASSSVYLYTTTTTTLANDTYYWLAFSYDGARQDTSGRKMYVDGTSLTLNQGCSTPPFPGAWNLSAPCFSGSYRAGTNAPNGLRIGHLRFYDRQLSDAEVAQIAAGTG